MSDIKDKWIWPFELLDKLGEGGMGVVYRARYVKNDRQVAVKILPDDVTDPTILGRFDRELEILKKLRHPNIVHCFGGTTEGKHRYYAMEIVEGGAFDALLAKRGQLPWEMAVKYAQQMTAALEYAHASKVTHRDVKPGNFLIAANGQLKLSDFGLATFAAARNLTAAGKTMGTFRYMAPEQIRGKEVGPHSDLYSLGCVIYEMITGKPPFDGNTPAEILDQHLHSPAPRASATALDCPASLDRLIASLLEKDPLKRPASATQVTEALNQISPVMMVTTSPNQVAAKTVEADAVADKRPFSFWSIPPWIVIALIITPLLLSGWAMSLRGQAVQAEIAIQSWKDAWGHTDPNIKRIAAASLGKLAHQDESIAELLRNGITDTSPQVREIALVGLEKAGPASREYANEVRSLIQQDPEPSVRNQAQTTLNAIESGVSPGSSGGAGSWVLLLLGGAVAVGGYLFARRKFIAP